MCGNVIIFFIHLWITSRGAFIQPTAYTLAGSSLANLNGSYFNGCPPSCISSDKRVCRCSNSAQHGYLIDGRIPAIDVTAEAWASQMYTWQSIGSQTVLIGVELETSVVLRAVEIYLFYCPSWGIGFPDITLFRGRDFPNNIELIGGDLGAVTLTSADEDCNNIVKVPLSPLRIDGESEVFSLHFQTSSHAYGLSIYIAEVRLSDQPLSQTTTTTTETVTTRRAEEATSSQPTTSSSTTQQETSSSQPQPTTSSPTTQEEETSSLPSSVSNLTPTLGSSSTEQRGPQSSNDSSTISAITTTVITGSTLSTEASGISGYNRSNTTTIATNTDAIPTDDTSPDDGSSNTVIVAVAVAALAILLIVCALAILLLYKRFKSRVTQTRRQAVTCVMDNLQERPLLEERTEREVVGRVRETDVYLLASKLNTIAAKWRSIGMGLGFLHGELNNIQQVPTLLGPVDFLTRMLEDWSQWPTSSHKEEPTVAKLCKALRSPLVGAGTIANELVSAED